MNLEVRDKHGISSFDRLIAKLPEAAEVSADFSKCWGTAEEPLLPSRYVMQIPRGVAC